MLFPSPLSGQHGLASLLFKDPHTITAQDIGQPGESKKERKEFLRHGIPSTRQLLLAPGVLEIKEFAVSVKRYDPQLE